MATDIVRYLNESRSGPLVSKLRQTLEEAKQPRAAVPQWRAMIAAFTQKGVKKIEMDEAGIDDWFATLPDTQVLTKDEILEHLKRTSATVKEVVLGTPAYSSYRQPGGVYSEIFYIANSERANITDALEQVEWEMEELSWNLDRLIDDEDLMVRLEARRTQLVDQTETAYDFTWSHFTDPKYGKHGKNLIAHCRTIVYEDTYFIQEIQSDWAQSGRQSDWRRVGKGPFVTNTEAWAGLTLRRQLQLAADNPKIKRVAWMTSSMSNGGRQDLAHERQVAFMIEAYQAAAKPAETARFDELGGPALRDAANGAAKELAKLVADEATLKNKVARAKGAVQNAEKAGAGDDSARAGLSQAKAELDSARDSLAGLEDKMNAARANAARTSSVFEVIETSARKAGEQAALDKRLHNPNDMNGFYLKVLPKLAEKAVQGTNERVTITKIDLNNGAAPVEVPTLQMTDAVRAKLKQSLPLYSRAPLLREARHEFDPVVAEMVRRCDNMIGSPHHVRAVANLHDIATGKRVAGRYANRLVQFALDARDIDEVPFHETFHYAMDVMLSGREREIITEAFAPGSRLHQQVQTVLIERGDRALAAECQDPAEAAAQGFALWTKGLLNVQDTPAQGIFSDLINTVRDVARWLRREVLEHKYQNTEDLFNGLAHGELAERQNQRDREYDPPGMGMRA